MSIQIRVTICALLFAAAVNAQQPPAFDPFDATIPQIEAALSSGSITCQQLVQYYFTRMDALDIAGPKLNAVRTRNPQALKVAAQYDALPASAPRGPLFCIPVLVKDNISTTEMPTTAGSVALQDNTPPYEAFLVTRLKAAGAIIIAKGNMTEYANYLTAGMPAGYSSLGGYVLNAYDPRPIPSVLPNGDGRQALSPSGSSSGPGVAASANLAAATVGTETSGSILSPSNSNSDVGIKPTVGLISRHGVIPIAASQDTAGPIVRSVTDAAIMLGAMTGVDGDDAATSSQEGFALSDYTPYLKANGLNGKRLGVPAEYWSTLTGEQLAIAQNALSVMQAQGATIVNCSIATFSQLNAFSSSVLPYEFKRDLDAYLATLGPDAETKSLADVIAYNNAHAGVALKYGQTLALASQALDLYSAEPQYIADRAQDLQLAKVQGIDATMSANQLDALLFPGSGSAGIAAKAGYPTVIVPAGYLSTASPYGISFTGGAYSEATLISLAYSFEQATKVRQPPSSAWRVLPQSTSIQISSVVSYATGAAGPVAPGMMVAISGSGLGPDQAAAMSVATGRITPVAGTTRVLFDGVPAPILSAQANQIIAIVPYGTFGKTTAQVDVEYNGSRSANMPVALTTAAPAIFTSKPLGQGTTVIANADGTINSSTTPAVKGTYVTFYATGEGIPGTLGIDGRLATAPYQTPFLPVSITLNGSPITAMYAGAAPGAAGVMQVNAPLPADTASGTASLVLTVGTASSQTATVYVK
jgi:amidase